MRTAIGVSIGSIPMWAWHHQFVIAISALGFVPLVLYLAIWPGLFVWLLRRVTDHYSRVPLFVTVPLVWVGLEMLRGEVVFTGYPWFLVAHPFVPVSVVANYASLIGVYGVGALVMLTIGWGFDFARWTPGRSDANQRRGRLLRYVGAGGAITLFLGAAMMWPEVRKDGDWLVVGAVQTNVPQSNKLDWTLEQRLADLDRFIALTRLVSDAKQTDPQTGESFKLGTPDLIVWPETMYPWYWLNPDAVAIERKSGLTTNGNPSTAIFDELMALQREMGVPMIVGAVAADGLSIDVDASGELKVKQDAVYNSAFVIHDGAVDPKRYDKVHLTPFGEVMPYISAWPWLEKKLLALGAGGMSFDLAPGTSASTLSIDIPERGKRAVQSVALATPICFESTMTGVCRELVYAGGKRRARAMVNLTNDGWFMWHDGGRKNHLLQARWRCIELGTPMIRAANTGISAVIDSHGRILARGTNIGKKASAARSDGALWAQFRLPDTGRVTMYGRTGNLVGWMILGMLIVVMVLTCVTPPQPAPELTKLPAAPDDAGRLLKLRQPPPPEDKAPPLKLVGQEPSPPKPMKRTPSDPPPESTDA